jgi:multidrug efflux pump subunit AcrA (membrane-fusion protein)
MRLSATTAGFTAGAVAAAAISLVLLGRSGHGTPNAGAAAQAPAMSVPVASVVRQTVPVYLNYIGTTEEIRTDTLQAQVTGYLASRGAPDGADVKQGELLYQTGPRDYQAALSQVKAQAQHDAAAYDYTRASQHRNSVLSKDGWVATDTLDQTTSNFHQSEATLAADAAAIQTAELKLGYTEIRAPFAGRLGKSLVHEGALINAAGTQFNTLVEFDPIYVTFNRLRKYARNSCISLICWRLADGWRADLWIVAVLPGENHAVGQTPGMTTPRQSAAWGSAPSCTLPQSR